jgi:hypothetical protein
MGWMYEDRREYWFFVNGADSNVWKMNFDAEQDPDSLGRVQKMHPWFKTDYSLVTNAQLVFLSKDWETNRLVPTMFFDTINALTLTDSELYTGYKTINLLSYHDLRTGFDPVAAFVQTQDYNFGVDTRILNLNFQAMTENLTDLIVEESINEGRTWDNLQTFSIPVSPDLMWFNYHIDVTTESIRFRFTTSGPVSIGDLKMEVLERKRELTE